jgi:hypothetical protein
MNNLLFIEIKKGIFKWVMDSYEELGDRNISVEILMNENDCLRIELNFGEFLAEILVEKPDFAPYRYVYFQAVGIVNGVPELLYFWYDNDETTIEEIIENLENAIKVCLLL